MSIQHEHPDHESVARLFELSAGGETENAEFSRLTDEVYGSMFERYSQPDAAAGFDSDEPVT